MQRVCKHAAICLDGEYLRLDDDDDMEGFCARASGSFFQALLDDEVSALMDINGALVVESVAPDQLRAVWTYLCKGVQPRIRTYGELWHWRNTCDYLSLGGVDPLHMLRDCRKAVIALITPRYIQIVPKHGMRSLSYRLCLDCTGAWRPKAVRGFDATCPTGSLSLISKHGKLPMEVELDPSIGKIKIRFLRNCCWQDLTTHVCLQHKTLTALSVQWLDADFLKIYVRVTCTADCKLHDESTDLRVALWPSFWYIIPCKNISEDLRSPATVVVNSSCSVAPGARCILQDGLSLQLLVPPGRHVDPNKYVLSFSGGFLEHEVEMKIHGPPTPRRWDSGKGKGSKGRQKNRGMGAFMKDLWVVRTHGDSLTVLIHLNDERVALAQLFGRATECIPEVELARWPTVYKNKLPIWGPSSFYSRRAYVDTIPAQCMPRRYRGSLDVPRCNEVLSVVPASNNDIIVVHRATARAKPRCWVVSPPPEATYRTFFICHDGVSSMGHIKGKGKGKYVPRVGSWSNKWCPNVPISLPRDFMDAIVSNEFCVELIASRPNQTHVSVEKVRLQGASSGGPYTSDGTFTWRLHAVQQDVIEQPVMA